MVYQELSIPGRCFTIRVAGDAPPERGRHHVRLKVSCQISCERVGSLRLTPVFEGVWTVDDGGRRQIPLSGEAIEAEEVPCAGAAKGCCVSPEEIEWGGLDTGLPAPWPFPCYITSGREQLSGHLFSAALHLDPARIEAVLVDCTVPLLLSAEAAPRSASS